MKFQIMFKHQPKLSMLFIYTQLLIGFLGLSECYVRFTVIKMAKPEPFDRENNLPFIFFTNECHVVSIYSFSSQCLNRFVHISNDTLAYNCYLFRLHLFQMMGSSLGNIFVMGIGIQLEVKWSYAWSCFIILLIIFGVSRWILIWFTPGTPCFMRDTSWFMASFLQSLATKLLGIFSKAKSVLYCYASGAPIA